MSQTEDEGVEPGDVGDDADALPDAASIGQTPAERETDEEPDTAPAA